MAQDRARDFATRGFEASDRKSDAITADVSRSPLAVEVTQVASTAGGTSGRSPSRWGEDFDLTVIGSDSSGGVPIGGAAAEGSQQASGEEAHITALTSWGQLGQFDHPGEEVDRLSVGAPRLGGLCGGHVFGDGPDGIVGQVVVLNDQRVSAPAARSALAMRASSHTSRTWVS